MIEYLSQVDPDNVFAALLLVVGGVTWLWRKARGEQTADIESILRQRMSVVVSRVLADESLERRARELMERAAWEALERVGVSRSATVERLVTWAVERALAELEEQLAERLVVRGEVERRLAELEAQVDDVRRAFVVPERPLGMEPLTSLVQFAEVPPGTIKAEGVGGGGEGAAAER